MASELFDYVYEAFPPSPPPNRAKSYIEEYTEEWNKAVLRLIESGADLSKIEIVGREKQRK